MMMRALTLVAVLTVITAGGAHAQPVDLKPYMTPAKAPAMSLTRDAASQSSRPVSVPVRYANAPVQLPRGIARTSVESRLSGDGPTASAGVLCGLKPSADYSGMGTARGYDNDGRFVGAKLAFTF